MPAKRPARRPATGHASVRIYDLAREFGVHPDVIMTELEQLGEFVRSPSNTVSGSVARKLRLIFPVSGLPAAFHAAIRERRLPDAWYCLDTLRRHDQQTWVQLQDEIGALVRTDIGRSRAEWLTGLWLLTSRTAANLAPTTDTPKSQGSPPAENSDRPPEVRRHTGQRPEESGQVLEDGFGAVLRTMFELAGHEVRQLRPQNRGTQYGHDFETETVDPRGGIVRCHFECKNQLTKVKLEDIAPKVLEELVYWNGVQLDYFVVVAPRAQVVNEISLLAQQCNERFKFPYQILVWSPDEQIEELIQLNPELHGELYEQGAEDNDPRRREEIARRWAARLPPIPRIPDSVKLYLTDPGKHLLYGESDFETVRTDPIDLGVLDGDGHPLPGTLRETVRGWLAEQENRPLLLLADFGDGKSFFGYDLGLRLAEEYLTNPSGGWICLRISLRSLRGNSDPVAMLEKRLRDIGVSLTEWMALVRSGRTLVILDGFDEMSAQLDQQTLDTNTAVLAACVSHFQGSKVMISSRTHFFDRVTDHRRFMENLGDPRLMRIAPIPFATRIAYLEAYAARAGKAAILERLQTLNDPIGLAAKPLFLQMIKAVLPDLADDELLDEITLYERFTDLCLRRKIDDLQSPGRLLGPGQLIANVRELLKVLAIALHTSTDDYVNLRDFNPGQPGREGGVARLLWEMTDTESVASATDARTRVGERSLLKQIAGVNAERWPVDFFHRSMREFFVAQALVDSVASLDGSLLGTVPLQPEIVGFARLLMSRSRNGTEIFTQKLMSLARSAVLPLFEGNYRGGNALTLLRTLAGRLPRADWSELALDHADLSEADLSGLSFRGSSLRNASLDNTDLRGTDLRYADLTGVRLEPTGGVRAVTLDPDSGVVYAAYNDSSLRRWKLDSAGRTQCETIAQLDFAPGRIDLSPFGDLLASGQHRAGTRMTEIISPVGTGKTWKIVSSFQVREEIPATDTGADSVNASHPVFPGARNSVCTDIVDIGNGRWLVAAGHASGSISLWRWPAEYSCSPFDGDPLGWDFLGEHPAHVGPVADIRISRTHIVSGGMDDPRIYVQTHNASGVPPIWPTGTPLVLRRTFSCEGVLTNGIRGEKTRLMLESLRDSATHDQ